MNMHMYLRIACVSDDACQFLNYDRNKIVKSYTPHILTCAMHTGEHIRSRPAPGHTHAEIEGVNFRTRVQHYAA